MRTTSAPPAKKAFGKLTVSTPPTRLLMRNVVRGTRALSTRAALSTVDGPAVSSVSASLDVSSVVGRVRLVGKSRPPRVNQSWMVSPAAGVALAPPPGPVVPGGAGLAVDAGGLSGGDGTGAAVVGG